MTRGVLDGDVLAERLAGHPRISLGTFPTPLEPWTRLGDRIGLPDRLLAKREDLSGFAFGGNKVRQLEFLLGDALANGADTVVHGGALQSNYCRVLAAASAKLGLECHLVLSRAYGQPEDQANMLLDRLAGASLHLIDQPLGSRQESIKQRLTERLAARGRRPYLITYPRSETLGTLAFVEGALETYRQCRAMDRLPSDLVIAAVGSAQAGFMLGARLLGWPLRVHGVSPLSTEYPVTTTIAAAATAAARLLGVAMDFEADCVHSDAAFVGAGYAQATREGLDAIRAVARTEGVFLDPVYTGKAMAALISYAERGNPGSTGEVIFVHTGGNVALFAYRDAVLNHDREVR